jgi:hypothetical protein
MTHGQIARALTAVGGLTAAALGHAAAPSPGPGTPAAAGVARGDRQPAVNCVYPAAAFRHAGKGGRLLDVTQPPFGAKGDGKTDDTGALLAALNYVVSHRVPAFCSRDLREGSFALYLPDGTYLVSDTVARSLPVLVGAPPYDRYRQHWVVRDEELENREVFPVGRYSNEQNDGIIILGQSRARTIIRLRDQCPGFGAGQSKAVVAFYRLNCGSNVNLNNVLENITLDTGRGNPGAIGLRWNASNAGAVRNVAILSADGAGVAGMLCDVRNAQGLVEDIHISGFDTGLSVSAGAATVVTLEHATLGGQGRDAIRLANMSCLAARDVVTEGAPTALRLESSSHAVITDSAFRGNAGGAAAIELGGGHLLARAIETTGYRAAVERNGQALVANPCVDEFVSDPVLNLYGAASAGRSLRLPVQDAPLVPHEANPANWAVVDDFGARGDGSTDDTDAIQRAMNSGKPAVLFPQVAYAINGTVAIPATVRQITFLYGCAIRTRADERGMFRVAEASGTPLRVQQNLNAGGLFLEHAAARTLVLEDVVTYFPFIWSNSPEPQTADLVLPWKPARPDGAVNRWRVYRNATPEGPPKQVFVNNTVGFAAGGPGALHAVENVVAWCRQANTEHEGVDFAFRRSTVWMLGVKTEIDGTHFCAQDGTRLEVLGGLYYQGGPQPGPVVIARDSDISLTLVAFSSDNPSRVILEDTRAGKTSLLRLESCPLWNPQNRDMPILPLLLNQRP